MQELELDISDSSNAPLALSELIEKGKHRRLEGDDALTQHSNRTERKQRPGQDELLVVHVVRSLLVNTRGYGPWLKLQEIATSLANICLRP